MADEKAPPGIIAWTDLTIKDAEKIRDFYSKVVGWKAVPVSMGEYEDYNMFPEKSEAPTAGICHARGGNEGLPPQWMIYIIVDDIEKSIAACERNGGRVIAGPKAISGDKYCVIEDPAGAVAALYEKN